MIGFLVYIIGFIVSFVVCICLNAYTEKVVTLSDILHSFLLALLSWVGIGFIFLVLSTRFVEENGNKPIIDLRKDKEE